MKSPLNPPVGRSLLAVALLLCQWLHAVAGAGDQVIVVYNKASADSKSIAYYYAEKRNVPTNQVVGFDLPDGEQITRAEFRDRLEKPLLKTLEESKLWVFGPGPLADGKEGGQVVTEAKVRYAVLCYGVPLKITKDTTLVEPGMEKIRDELRRNEAAVDSELAILPQFYQKPGIYGPRQNPVFRATNSAAIHPTNGVLVVTRLDGPTPAIARGLVDKALQADFEGLWGRAYFDVRGITNGNYQLGDEWIRFSADVVRRLGYETVMDERPETFPVAFPLSQVAFYAGWYDANVSGPFALPTVEFMPGAFAYHLHSYSAVTIHNNWQYWVGPLLWRGATCTMGCVDEPYLEGTPVISVFFWGFCRLGFTFGEAACASQGSLSWQTTVVGDPLYQPFAVPPDKRHESLVRRNSKLLEWSFLKVVNMNALTGVSPADLIDYVEKLPIASTSAVLQEKLGDLDYSSAHFTDAIDAYRQALKFDMSEQQRIRVTLSLGRTLALYQQKEEALEVYEKFLKDHPKYPDLAMIYDRLHGLARDLKKTAEAERYEQELKRLAPVKP